MHHYFSGSHFEDSCDHVSKNIKIKLKKKIELYIYYVVK